MKIVPLHTANTTLPHLLARVEAGEKIVLELGMKPIAKLVPFHPRPIQRQFVALPGTVCVGPEFFDPVPDEELAGCE